MAGKAKTRECEDCGEEVPYRRLRCRRCRLLVCSWCYGHIHALEIAKDEVRAKQESAR